VDFRLFHHVHADDVFAGKDDYLFRPSELYDLNANYGMTEEQWHERMELLKNFSAHAGSPVIVVIAPAKSHFYREYIPPERLLPNARSFYSRLREELDGAEIPFIDLNETFLRWKPAAKYPLYAKTGIHWTEYGAILAMDSMLRYAEALTHQSFPHLHWNTVNLLDTPSALDADILMAINLINPVKSGKLAYPVLDHHYPDSVRKPNMLVIADSYYHALLWSGVHTQISDTSSAFWYYGKEAFSSGYNNMPVEKLDMKKELKGRDFILVLFTPANYFDAIWKVPALAQ
jgi:hypothetical protein